MDVDFRTALRQLVDFDLMFVNMLSIDGWPLFLRERFVLFNSFTRHSSLPMTLIYFFFSIFLMT